MLLELLPDVDWDARWALVECAARIGLPADLDELQEFMLTMPQEDYAKVSAAMRDEWFWSGGFLKFPDVWVVDQLGEWPWSGQREIMRAVHDAGGRMMLQLWHVGRISHPSYLDGAAPVSNTLTGSMATSAAFAPAATNNDSDSASAKIRP